MKTLSLLLVAVFGGAAGGAALTWFLKPAAAASPETVVTGPASSFGAAQARKEMEVLREETRALRDRVLALEARPEPVAAVPFVVDETREELAALARKVEDIEGRAPQGGALDAVPAEDVAAAPAFSEAVEKTLQSIRKREKATAWRGGVQKRQAANEERLKRLQTELNLTTVQTEDLREAFDADAARGLELIRLWEEGNTPERELGEVKRRNQEQSQQALQSILTPVQLEQYRASNQGWGGK